MIISQYIEKCRFKLKESGSLFNNDTAIDDVIPVSILAFNTGFGILFCTKEPKYDAGLF